MPLSLLRKGISPKGFRSVRGLHEGNWKNLENVQIRRKEKDVEITFTGRWMPYDIHHYAKEDYSAILDLLQDNLPKEKLKLY